MPDDKRRPVPAGEVHTAISSNRRRVEIRNSRKTGALNHGVAVFGVDCGQNPLIRLREVQQPVIQHWRWHIRSALVDRPDNAVGIGDIAPGIERQCQKRVTFVTAHAVNDAAFHNWTRSDVAGQPFALPDNVSGVEVITANHLRRGRDDLCLTAMLNDSRCRPGIRFVAVFFPQRLTGLSGEHLDTGLPRMVANDDNASFVNDR